MTTVHLRKHWCGGILALFMYLLRMTYAQSDAIRLQNAIIELANEQLGVQDSIDYFNRLNYTLVEGDESQKVIQEIAADLFFRLQSHVSMVTQLRNKLYGGKYSYTRRDNCGSFVGGEYDSRFGATVDQESICVEGITQQPQVMEQIEGLFELMKGNLQSEPTLRWQYIITEDGYLFRFPAIGRDVSSVVYDPRLLPRYRLTRSTVKRDVVILLQMSSSINVAFGAAKNATKTILNSLNIADRVSVLAFSNGVLTAASLDTYDPCYNSKLADVNPTTLGQLLFFVDRLNSPAGNANYSNAFATAFQLFNCCQSMATDRSIVLLTDGANLINDYNNTVNAIRNGNRAFGNKVAIFIYSFNIRDPNVNTLLTKLALQEFVDKTGGEQISNDLKSINASSNMRSQMSNFFVAVKAELNAPVVFSSPFYDQLSGDLCMSLCLSFALSDGPIGTACVDVTISSLFREVVYFEKSSSSYVFLVDGKGNVLIHPLLPSPQSSSPETTPVSLNQIESDDSGQITQLQQDMINSTKFQETVIIYSQHVFPRGYSPLEGVNAAMVSSTYRWQRVNGTNFTVCLVTTDGYVNISLNWTENYYPPVFLTESVLHNLDNSPEKMCNYHDTGVTVKNLSCVKLAPQNFYDPQSYLDRLGTTELVSNWTQFLQKEAEVSQEIKGNVRAAVASTAFLESIWQSHPFDAALWRYIGLREGVMRLFPASYVAKQYDPTERSWYRQAVANPNAYALYGPYPDASTEICVVTLAKAIIRNTERTNSSTIVGVMAMDFKLSTFNQILQDNFRSCSKTGRCFIMDQGGFVIIHPDFVVSSEKCPNFRDQHVTCLEKFVAQQMINKGVLVSDFCVSFVNLNNIKYWKVVLDNENITTPVFDVYGIPSTNVYVVQIHQDKQSSSTDRTCSLACVAQYDSDGPQGTCSSITLKSNLSLTCEVPCYTATQYSQLCLGQLQQVNSGRRGAPPCLPPPPTLTDLFVNFSSWRDQLCSCETGCNPTTTGSPTAPSLPSVTSESTTAQIPVSGTPAAPNLLPLLALLVLLVILAIVLIVVFKMKPGKNSKSSKRENYIMTDSHAYVSYNVTRYRNNPPPDDKTYDEIQHPVFIYGENGAFEGARSESTDDRLQAGVTANFEDERGISGMSDSLGNGINGVESVDSEEKENAAVNSTYITAGDFEHKRSRVHHPNPLHLPVGTGRFGSNVVTFLHVIEDSTQTSNFSAPAPAAAAITVGQSKTLKSDHDDTTHEQLSAMGNAESSPYSPEYFTATHTIDSDGSKIPVQQQRLQVQPPLATGRGGTDAAAANGMSKQFTATFV